MLLLLFFQAVAGTLTLGFTGGLESSTAEVFVYDERSQLNPQASIVTPDVADQVADIEGVDQAAAIGIGSFTGQGPDGDVDVTLFGGPPDSPAIPRTISDGRQAEACGEALFSGSSLGEGFEMNDRVTVGVHRPDRGRHRR